jgi:hypothetical protein
MDMQRSWLLMIATFLAAITVMAQGRRRDEGWAALMPPGNGRGLITVSCTGCHGLRVIVNARRTPAEWSVTLNDMIQRGSPVFPDEIEMMSNYLARSFPATLPKLVNANTASREEMEKLPGMNAEIAARMVDARAKSGAFGNSEAMRRALGMEKTEFEKIVYLFKYSD